MKALILAGGEATRLRPLTCNTPKAMVPVLNTPFLEHVIRRLRDHQVDEVVLALGYLPGPVTGYFGDGSRFGVRLIHLLEEKPLGTAGAVKNAEKYLDESFFVLNGDIFTSLDFSAMYQYHRQKKAKVTISLVPVEDPTAYGLVEMDAQGRVTRFLEKPTRDQITTYNINAGVYIIEPDVLNGIPPQTRYSFERQLFPQLLQKGAPVYGYASSGYWIDMGTPSKYLQLNCDLLTGKCPGYAHAGNVQIGEGCSIHKSAVIKAPVLIGDNCTVGRGATLTGPAVIGSGCVIPEEAVIEGSVVWHNVKFGARVNLKNSIVANDCNLNADCEIEDSVIGDNVTVSCGCKVELQSKISPGTCVEAKSDNSQRP